MAILIAHNIPINYVINTTAEITVASADKRYTHSRRKKREGSGIRDGEQGLVIYVCRNKERQGKRKSKRARERDKKKKGEGKRTYVRQRGMKRERDVGGIL